MLMIMLGLKVCRRSYDPTASLSNFEILSWMFFEIKEGLETRTLSYHSSPISGPAGLTKKVILLQKKASRRAKISKD